MRTVKITKEFLESGGTPSGKGYAWNNAQFRLLGVDGKKGWMLSLINTEISEGEAQRFLELNPKRSGGTTIKPDIDPQIKLNWNYLLNRAIKVKGDVYVQSLIEEIHGILDDC